MTTATATAPAIELDEALKSRVHRLAEQWGKTPLEIVREALVSYLDREEEEAFYQEALRAERRYQETGLHITLDELFAWFDRLDADPDAPPPPCHT